MATKGKANGKAANGRGAEADFAGGEEIKSRVVDVSPEKAAKWLERNHPDNRGMAYQRVEGFASDMRAGSWKVTHQGIAFDSEGRLIDGQHRLHAVINAGVTVRMMVVWNVGEFGDPIDCGRPRSLGTLAGTTGKHVALANGLRMLEQGYQDNRPMTLADFREVSGHHEQSIALVLKVPHYSRVTAGMLAGLAYAEPLASAEVVAFGTQVTSGERLVRGEPAYSLFHWREANRNVPTWTGAMATLNAVRAHLAGAGLGAIFTTESGYRAVTAKRRVMKVPHTPKADVVVPGISLAQKAGPRNRQDEPAPAPSQRVLMTFEEEG